MVVKQIRLNSADGTFLILLWHVGGGDLWDPFQSSKDSMSMSEQETTGDERGCELLLTFWWEFPKTMWRAKTGLGLRAYFEDEDNKEERDVDNRQEDIGNQFDQEKVCRSILTNRLGKMVTIYTHFLGNIFVGKFIWISHCTYCVSRCMMLLQCWWWWWSSLKMRTECDMWWQGLARAPTPPQVIPAIWSGLDFNWHRWNILNIERETFRCNNWMTLCVWMFCHPPQLVS